MPQFKKKYLLLIVFGFNLFMITSCKQSKNKQSNELAETFVSPVSGCYQLIIKEDTAFMKIDINGGKVQGDLKYSKKEKDNNVGTFTGTVLKDTIDMMYSFMSEGMISYRQIKMIHLKEGYAEGYGELIMKGDTALFKYPNGLQFETNHLYKNIKCP